MIGGFLVTSMIGSPLAALLARPQEWMDDGADDPLPSTQMTSGIGGFQPLDLGPDLMCWPSEIERPSTSAPLPDWPSKSWDDPHFGVNWVKDTAAESEKPVAKKRTQVQRERPAKQQRKRVTRERQLPQTTAEEAFFEPEPEKVAARQIAQAKEQVKQAAHQAVSNAVGAEMPSPAELEAMVGTLGLAGTVQEIMKRTDWDFRKAAHFLAKARQKR